VVVIEDGKAVGFSNLFIPGGTIEQDITRPFKLKWLAQLITTVDDLNLKYGISHLEIYLSIQIPKTSFCSILISPLVLAQQRRSKNATISKASFLRCTRSSQKTLISERYFTRHKIVLM
jgi:hypothetical protein